MICLSLLSIYKNLKSKDSTHVSLDIHQLRDDFVEGNDKAYSVIYKLYAGNLYAFGLSLGARTEVIEDAIHDVFVEIYTHRHYLKKINNLKYYLLTAFRNRLFLLMKENSKIQEITERDINGLFEVDYQQLWIENENDTQKQDLVKRLLSELNQNQREAIYLRYVEGLSCEEIARLMNINYQSVKNLIHRSIKKLKSVIAFVVILVLCCLPNSYDIVLI